LSWKIAAEAAVDRLKAWATGLFGDRVAGGEVFNGFCAAAKGKMCDVGSPAALRPPKKLSRWRLIAATQQVFQQPITARPGPPMSDSKPDIVGQSNNSIRTAVPGR
jgi:hypothetical protein